MIIIKNLTKTFKRYTVQNQSLKSLILHWRRHKKSMDQIDTLTAIHNLNLVIPEGEVFCITGPNGAGKSTLAKLIAGTIQPTSGSIERQGKIVPFLELGVAFNHELSGIDNVYLNGVLLGIDLAYLRKHKDEIFAFAELDTFAETPLKYYSSGMQLRLAFAIAMHAKGEIYIFDEILAVGDSGFQKKCLDCFHQLVSQKKTVIIISHDLEFIKKHADRLLVITPQKHFVLTHLPQAAYDINALISHCDQAVQSVSS
ncbi:hypothetical protein AYO45_01235 [Gammaproteobacteria bacterium SCGC AG-212-F23]|nr:hypothetical protein AYO45_01235 [Gammaproteobacteria bacterium SCGC AG-212-F23]